MKTVSSKLLNEIACAPLNQAVRQAVLDETGVETIDELFWGHNVAFMLNDKARFAVSLKNFNKEHRFSIVYQTEVRGHWYNQEEDLLEVVTPMEVFQVLRERLKVNKHPGARVHWDNKIPGYDRQTRARDHSNKITNLFRQVALVESKDDLFTFARLELMYDLMNDHHLYGGVVDDEKVFKARSVCVGRAFASVTSSNSEDASKDIEDYRLAMITFMLNQGISFKEHRAKLEINRSVGKYLLGRFGETYPASVDHFTMAYYSWEQFDDAGNYGWFSNNSEHFSPRDFDYVARAFATRCKDAFKATIFGQELENIHHVEMQSREKTDWELNKEEYNK